MCQPYDIYCLAKCLSLLFFGGFVEGAMFIAPLADGIVKGEGTWQQVKQLSPLFLPLPREIYVALVLV